jgi:hypothetical protein
MCIGTILPYVAALRTLGDLFSVYGYFCRPSEARGGSTQVPTPVSSPTQRSHNGTIWDNTGARATHIRFDAVEVRPTSAALPPTPTPPTPKPAAVERAIPPLRPSPTDFSAPRTATDCQRAASETVSAQSSGVDARSGVIVATTAAQPIGTSTATAAGGQSEHALAVSPAGAPPVKTNKRSRFDDVPAAVQSIPVKGQAVVEEVLLPLPGTMQGTVAPNSGSQQPLSLPNRPNQNPQLCGGGTSQVHLKESISLPDGTQITTPSPHPEHSAQTPRSPRRRTSPESWLRRRVSPSASQAGTVEVLREHTRTVLRKPLRSPPRQSGTVLTIRRWICLRLHLPCSWIGLDSPGPTRPAHRPPSTLFSRQRTSRRVNQRGFCGKRLRQDATRQCAGSPDTTSSYIRRHRRDGLRSQQSRG